MSVGLGIEVYGALQAVRIAVREESVAMKFDVVIAGVRDLRQLRGRWQFNPERI